MRVETDHGTLGAKHAVLATLLPFSDSGFFARARATSAYGFAARIRGAPPAGMYITAEPPTRSVRPWSHSGGTGVVVVGEEHETGTVRVTFRHYQQLEEWAQATFDVESIAHRWSAHDYTTVDHIPDDGGAHPCAIGSG